MRHPVFAANWKMNQAPADAKAFMKQFIATYPRQQDRQVLFFPPALSISELRAAEDGETSNAIRARVVTARSRQQRRFEGTPATVNARMSHAQIRRHCALPPVPTNSDEPLQDHLQLPRMSAPTHSLSADSLCQSRSPQRLTDR